MILSRMGLAYLEGTDSVVSLIHHIVLIWQHRQNLDTLLVYKM